jgi:hypothetical protein
MANATVTVLEADGTTETDVVVLDVGRQAAAASKSLTLATEDKAVLDSLATKLDTVITAVQIIDNSISGSETQVDVVAALPAGTNNIGHVGGTDYETVAASQTDQMLGATGAAGDYLAGVLIIPATTSPGAVSIEDGATNIPIFTGGASSVTNLVPFFVPLGIKSGAGAWTVTTGTNVSVIAVGNFT